MYYINVKAVYTILLIVFCNFIQLNGQLFQDFVVHECKTAVNKGNDSIKKCCPHILSIAISKEICLLAPKLYNKDIHDVEILERQYKECDLIYAIAKNETWIDDNLIYNCVKFSLNSIDKGEDIKEKLNNTEIHKDDRNLQLSGFLNNFGIPTFAAGLSTSSSLLSEGDFFAQHFSSCSTLLSLYFVRTCSAICEGRAGIGTGRVTVPQLCLPYCQNFAKHACIRGCKHFGCPLSYNRCMDHMC
ncbi:uncharacterized protein CMU_030430 [Cryptosporidium muris RN66]|uniref:Uncharacterized protein n=1 Tax=Cryptosporidium muris (strain RN66) TaxID=441375 RepID=B6AK13_CRYMR|nr:uncharacterized protein CMU_030430 [Cryptosporidium muris RN66]EEA08554.1 hypothetical protein CMU_030430 [Cryptosporidium muris RN66]|eukprot:XP_002142903.1 hypothetical protein [Cryptosporidium muris RN66]